MKNRGFTLVELLIVIIIITILAGIITTAYILYANRSADSQAKSLTTQIVSASERYYNKNLEYATATVLQGGNTPPTSTIYTSIASTLDTSVNGLSGSRFKFFPCSGTCTVPNTTGDYVYYLTKGVASGTSKAYTFGGCTFTFPTSEDDGASFVMAYKQKENSTWKFYRSVNGNPTTSNTTTCPFSA